MTDQDDFPDFPAYPGAKWTYPVPNFTYPVVKSTYPTLDFFFFHKSDPVTLDQNPPTLYQTFLSQSPTSYPIPDFFFTKSHAPTLYRQTQLKGR
jgi:hypothetical protein